MKKYLLMGGLALASIAYITTGCSRDDLSGSVLQIKEDAFRSAFISEYGTPDPNQTWGFPYVDLPQQAPNRGITRGTNPDANMWAATWLVPDTLTTEQKDIVRQYFQQNDKLSYTDPQWSNYFIQQVYKGGTNTEGSKSTEKYTSANNGVVVGSDHMDHLEALSSTGARDHIYNFNYGDCTVNHNVMNNGTEVNDADQHSDKIQLMVDSYTYTFGYFNSDGSLGKTDKCALVSWTTIRDWANKKGLNGNCLDDGWNRSFMGFDFEQIVGDDVYAKSGNDYLYATYDGPATDGRIWDGKNVINTYSGYSGRTPIYAEGYETMKYNGQPVHLLSSDQNTYCGHFIEYTSDDDIVINIDGYGKCLNMEKINNDLLSQGYLPVSGGNLKKWVKVQGGADGYYSDWIVTLCEAQLKDGNPEDSIRTETILKEEGRVFAEDLGSANNTDIDYNDVVFDAKIYVVNTYKKAYNASTQTYDEEQLISTTTQPAEITVLAAGGTLNLVVGNREVHQLFGVNTDVMVNTYVEGASPTLSGKHTEGKKPVRFFTSRVYDHIIDIPIVVTISGEPEELRATKGDAPHKICVPIGTRWLAERVAFHLAYTGFESWAKGSDSSNLPWSTPVSDYLYQSDDDPIIYAWVGSQKGISNGGTVTATGESSIGKKNNLNALTVAGKKEDYTAEKGYVEIALDRNLQEGDEIAISAFRFKDTDASGTLYIAYMQGETVKEKVADNFVFNNTYSGGLPNQNTYVVPASAAGSNKIRLTRNSASTNVYITNIIITRKSLLSSNSQTEVPVNTNTDSSSTSQGSGSSTSTETTTPTYTITGTVVTEISSSTNLSDVEQLTVPSSYLDGAQTATVYVYGEDQGNGTVSVGGITVTANAAPTRGTAGTTLACKLGPVQIAAAGSTGTAITGSNFIVHKVSVQKTCTTDPSVSKPEGTEIPNVAKLLPTWGTNVIEIDKSNFSSVVENSIIYVAGVGYETSTGPWYIETLINKSSGWEKINDNYSGSTTVGVTKSWTLSSTQANDLKNNGLIIQGCNFRVKYVTIKNPASTGGGNSNIITLWEWQETDWDKSGSVRYWDNGYASFGNDASIYNGANAGSIIRIYGTPAADNWYIRPRTGYNQSGISYQGLPADTYINSTNVSSHSENGCIKLVFDNTTAGRLASENGFTCNIQHYYVTKVTFEKK